MKTVPIGIDLGTTNCCISWMDGDAIKVYQDGSLITIPSIVAQTKDGTILAGWRAKRAIDPVFRHGFAKRYLGTSQGFRFLDGEVPAWMISQHLLKHLKECAENALAAPVAAVVTYPAHFSQVQIDETRRAAQGAGLELIDLLTEPVAAAIASKHEKKLQEGSGEQLIGVFDMGGGTTDITICMSSDDRIEVTAGGRAFSGDNFLGGVDFDKALVSIALEKMNRQNLPTVSMGKDLPELKWLWDLMISAERCKLRLSDEEETQWKQELCDSGGTELASLDCWISRGIFEQGIGQIVDRALGLCDKALLRHAGFNEPDGSERLREGLRKAASALSQIILVGGSTRVPLVRERIKAHHRELGAGNVVVTSFREDEAVAMGAAVFAATSITDRPPVGASSWLNWTVPPRDRVSSDVPTHPSLRASAGPQAGAGWTVRYRAGNDKGTVPVNGDGRFGIPAFALAEGDNPIELELVGPDGNTRETHTTGILRGGFSIGEPGLAHPIYIRLVDGMYELVKMGTHAGSLSEAKLYTNDKTTEVRAPLYEGHALITTIKFAANAEPGTPVIIRSFCDRQRLELEFQVGNGPIERRPVELMAVAAPFDPDDSFLRYQTLLRDIEKYMKNLPQGSTLQRAMEKEWQAMKLDLEIELANSGLRDHARIDDRLRQILLFSLRLQAYSLTPDGLRDKAATIRQQVRAAGADADLLQELDNVEAEISDCEDAAMLSVLDSRLKAVSRNIYSRDRSEVSPALLAIVVEDFRDRISRIRLAASTDQKIADQIKDIESTIDHVLTMSVENAAKFNRLLILQHDRIDPLYQSEVTRRGQEGLLRGTPR